MNGSITRDLIDPADGPERNVEKLLIIAHALMRHVEQSQGQKGAAFEEFRRAAVLEDLVRRRTRDLNDTLALLNKATAAAERARRDLEQAIETIQEGFALFDASERLVLCNSRFCRDIVDARPAILPGIAFEDYVRLVSRSAQLALPEGTTPEDWHGERMRRHREPQIFNVGLVGDRWLQISERRTTDGGTVVLQTDLTDIIRAERAERGKLLDDQARMIRATLDHINQGVGIFDAGARLVGWNARLFQLLDMPMSLMRRGTGFDAFAERIAGASVPGEGVTIARVWEWVRGPANRAALAFEITRDSGIVLDVFAQEMPGRGFVMSFSDITRERLAIHAFRRANATLEARVAIRTEELSRALATAELANATRVRFVAAASHDLLQPLSAAKLFVAAARDEAGSAAQGGMLEKARNALTSVEGILAALLDISRLESGGTEVEIAAVPLSVLLGRLSDEFAPLAARKGLRLTIVPCRLAVRSDPAYLRRILQNLISNAIRYTSEGRVLVGARRRRGGLRIEVRDTGPGIAPEHRQAIFREFHRIEGSASAAEGMGLGLAIVDRACALLGHRLTLESTLERGTCFAIDLDLAPWLPPIRDVPVEIPAEPGECVDRIALLVENDAELRRAITLLLERRGVTVLEAGNGAEALALVEEIDIAPDFLLVDQQLGEGQTGIETVLELHARHGPRPSRIITANRSPETRAAARAAGLEIMFKPIDPEALEAFVKLALDGGA